MDALLQAIKDTMSNKSNLTEEFFNSVLQRLIFIGYAPKENDAWGLCFAMQSIENSIKNSCNITSIPEGLLHIAVDMVCGEFLLTKKQTGQLAIGELNFDGVVTSIHEGDTTIQFSPNSSDEEKFNQLLTYLMHKKEGEFVCYRRVKW